jgi:MFS family permease
MELVKRRFMPLFYTKNGLSHTEIGVLMAVNPMANIFVSPSWSILADTYSKHRFILIVTSAFTGIIFPLNFFLTLSPSVPRFAGLLVIACLHSMCLSAQQSLLTDLALKALHPNEEKFGQQRVWGAVGWGVAYAFLGPLADWYGVDSIFAVQLICAVLFVAALFMSSLGLDVVVKQKEGKGRGDSTNGNKNATPLMFRVREVLRIPFQSTQTFLFFVMAFLSGAG